MKKITCKLGNMRKVADWVVYPRKDGDNTVMIQCDKRICRFDATTGKGKLSAAHNYPGFHTLMMAGAVDVIVPQEVIDAAIKATAKSGDHIGSGVYVA